LANARIYPDQPQGISRDDGEWVLGHREFRYAVVPEKAGALVLPEIRLQWWDTVANRQRTAVLPEHRIEVLASDLMAAIPQGPTGLVSDSLGRAGEGADGRVIGLWRLTTGIFCFLWLITLVMYLRGARTGSRPVAARQASVEEEDSLIALFRQACKRGDARQARNQLGRWVRKYGPAEAGGSLMSFASDQASPELAAAIAELDAGRFSARGESTWNGGELWRLFSAWQKSLSAKNGTAENTEFDLYASAR
jgi:hypothetical protein